jgi:uncharacterized protein (TIGR02453 family)
MLNESTLKFLRALKANNNRAWFADNRDRYKAAREDVVRLVDQLVPVIAAADPPLIEMDPADALFRINRDTRFARDKTPYKTNIGAFLTDRGRKAERAGYYLHVEPGGCFLAGGLYMPPTPQLRAVRKAIAEDARPLRKILAAPAFVKHFGRELPGDRVKTAPRDVPRDHPALDLLRYKSFEIMKSIPDQALLSAGFLRRAEPVFAAMSPYVRWLNAALDRHPPPSSGVL